MEKALKRGKIRKFKKKDADICSKIISNCIIVGNYVSKKIQKNIIFSTTPEELIKNMKKRKYFIYEKNNKILGIGALDKNEVRTMYTSVKSQSRGIGSKILKKLEQEARKNNFKKIFLYTHPRAGEFYLKDGFKLIKKIKDKLNKIETVFYMEKILK